MKTPSLCECGKRILVCRSRAKKHRWVRRKEHDLCDACWARALEKAKRGMRPHERVPELWEIGAR